jgi:site-specific DNA recombinase
MLTNSEEKIIRDIKSGKYKDHYLIYNRRSTDDADSQKNSISFQKSTNIKFAKENKIPIATITIQGFCSNGIISEKHSAFKENDIITFTKEGLVQYKVERPKFLNLSQFLNEKYFKGVVVLCWDRISRNKNDTNIINKLLKLGVDIRFVWARYAKTSAGALHMDIDGMFAEHHSRMTSEKVTETTRALRISGVCTYKAPIGYLNLGDMHNKPFDPKRAPIITEMFKKYSLGNWSIPDLTKWANEQGLTTVPMRRRRTEKEMLAEEEDEVEIEAVSRPMYIAYVHKILSNRFYTGKVLGNDGEWIDSNSHEAMISEELFNEVQKLRKKKNVSVHYTDKIDHPYRGFVRCECERAYCPYEQKGNLYFGVRCRAGCKNKNRSLNSNFIEDVIGEKILKLYFTDDELTEIDARTNTDLFVFEQKRKKELEQFDRQKRKVREDLDYLRSNKLVLLKTGAYTPEDLMREENSLNERLCDLQGKEQDSDRAIHEVVKDLIKLSELLKNVATYWQFAKTLEREKIARIIFSELSISDNNVVFSLNNGFKPFETRLFNECDPEVWLSELLEDSVFINSRVKELENCYN